MKVGMGILMQNPDNRRDDREVWQENLRLADLAEPLGFDSVWATEHHFTDYPICPDVLQFLTWVAARTERVEVGSQVVVLPWHNPLRVAEQIAVLDIVANGRFIFGFGRGAARVEFDGFRIPMAETRQRFVESAQLILQGLEQGYCEFQGEFIQQPSAEIRPRPFKSFKGRAFAAAISPETNRIIAELGVGLLINPQKPWETILQDLEMYRSAYREIQHVEAPAPVCTGFAYCDPDTARAEELMRRHIGAYYQSALAHYEFAGDHFKGTKGYEFYDKMSRILNKAGTDGATDFFMSLQVWGTPDQCIQKILDTHRKVGFGHLPVNFSFGHLPITDVERSVRLFAAEVMPVVQKAGAPAGA